LRRSAASTGALQCKGSFTLEVAAAHVKVPLHCASEKNATGA
jgi:hypothetical protein